MFSCFTSNNIQQMPVTRTQLYNHLRRTQTHTFPVVTLAQTHTHLANNVNTFNTMLVNGTANDGTNNYRSVPITMLALL